MKKAMAIVLLAFLAVTSLLATTQKNEELHEKLESAVLLGDLDEVKRLIEAGADLNKRFDFGASKDITVLVFAVMSDNADIAKVLIEAGADVNLKYKGDMTLLHVAARWDVSDTAVTELLIGKGLDVNAKIIWGRLEGATPLHVAAVNGNIGVVEMLIKNGAEVDAKLSDDKNVLRQRLYSPLHLATQNGHKAVAEILIAKGADVNAKSKLGETPLDLAISKGHKELADLLRKHGGISGKK